jgi:hypothetical protein
MNFDGVTFGETTHFKGPFHRAQLAGDIVQLLFEVIRKVCEFHP